MEKSGGEAGGEGQCASVEMPWRDEKKERERERERCSLEILLIKKEANLSGREMDEEEVGNGDIQGAT